VLTNGKASTARDRAEKGLQIITLEEGRPPTALTQQQVLMAIASGDECLAAFGLMHALDEAKLLEPLQCAIDAHQTEGAMAFAGRVIDLEGSDGSRTCGDGLHDRAPRGRKSIAVLL
jgi:hypothetical protein